MRRFFLFKQSPSLLCVGCICAALAFVICLALAAQIAQGASQTLQNPSLTDAEALSSNSSDTFAHYFFPSENYTVTGVSEDAHIVGMLSHERLDFVVMDIDTALLKAGWTVLPSEQGELHFYQRADPLQEPPYEGISYLMLVIGKYGDKTSVLVQMA